MTPHRSRLLAALLLAGTFVACGGGSGGSELTSGAPTTPTPTATVPPAVGAATEPTTFEWTEITGQLNVTPSSPTLSDLSCVDPSISGITGTIDVTWTGTQYDGTYLFGTQPVSCHIESITSSEPVNGMGDGDTAPDWEITGHLTAQLRAERSADADGRTYTIVTACTNSAGTARRASVVTVPHSH